MDTELHNLLFERHSIRRYQEQPIDPDTVIQILEAGLLAPSSKSGRPWQFVVVENRETLQEMAKCKPAGAAPIAKAAFAVVICVDPEKSDVYIEDSSVAATIMHLQAAALGIGSCWIQIRNRYNSDDEPAQNPIKELLGIPDKMQVVQILSFGISDEIRKPVDPTKLMWEKVHLDKWGEGE